MTQVRTVAARSTVLTALVQLVVRNLSLIRFVVVGGLSLAADTGSLYLFHGVLGIWLPVAAAASYAVAFVVNFGLIRIWVFHSSGALSRQLPRYVALVAVNLLATVTIVPWLTWLGLNYLLSKLITAAVLAIMNFFVSRRWIF